MKKKAIVLLAFTAALTAVSCQKEAMKEAESTPAGEGMTISAVTEGIGADVKADLAYKYDVIWRLGDKICVKNSENRVEFTLVDGAGTTKGTFRSTGDDISGEVEGFYPASVANLIWPAEQQNNQIPPMYCKKTLSSTQNQTFNFASLGSVLQLNFNSTTVGIVLKSIEVKADEAMSGAFTIENGQAKVSQPEGDKPGITLDLGEGVTLGTSAKKFNIAVPAGEYHGLSIVLTATNGKKCTINAKKDKAIEIVYNTVNTLAISGEFKYYVESISLDKSAVELKAGDNITLVATVLPDNATDKSINWSSDKADIAAVDETGKVTAISFGTATITATTTDGGKTATCTVTVKPDHLPDGALPGVFTVSNDGKKVFFSKGNLYAKNEGTAGSPDWKWHFYDKQYKYNSLNSDCDEDGNRRANNTDTEIDLFTWGYDNTSNNRSYSLNPVNNRGISGHTTDGDKQFSSSEDWGFVFGGKSSVWRTLTSAEWQYLFNTRTVNGGTKEGKSYQRATINSDATSVYGMILYPDNYTLQTGATSYTSEEWTTMEENGCVFLPAAGFRFSGGVEFVGVMGHYWSSTAVDEDYAYSVSFDSSDVVVPRPDADRNTGFSVRLITEPK